jgi:hypothetical protein
MIRASSRFQCSNWFEVSPPSVRHLKNSSIPSCFCVHLRVLRATSSLLAWRFRGARGMTNERIEWLPRFQPDSSDTLSNPSQTSGAVTNLMPAAVLTATTAHFKLGRDGALRSPQPRPGAASDSMGVPAGRLPMRCVGRIGKIDHKEKH